VHRVDVIKNDVEGAEMLVLRGAGRTLDQFHPVVIVELMEARRPGPGAEIDNNAVFAWAGGGAL
jgi:Methyltransferase FkbM domain